jgi:hypothetical protein
MATKLVAVAAEHNAADARSATPGLCRETAWAGRRVAVDPIDVTGFTPVTASAGTK